MERVRVVYKPDNSVAIIHPAPKSKQPNESTEEWHKRVFAGAMQGDLMGLPYDDLDISDLPQNRKNRDAWEGKKGEGITVNEFKAGKIKKDVEREKEIQEKIREIAIRELPEHE